MWRAANNGIPPSQEDLKPIRHNHAKHGTREGCLRPGWETLDRPRSGTKRLDSSSLLLIRLEALLSQH